LAVRRNRGGAARLAPLGALLLAACGDGRTGLLLEVTPGPGTAVAADTLRFVIATEITGAFVIDGESSVTASVTGRDLGQSPYRLLVSDGRMAGDRPLLAGVLALRQGEEAPVAFAALPPTRFERGEIRLHRLVLDPAAQVTLGPTGCVTWSGGRAVAPDDRDCDGERPPPGGDDCDDADPLVSPARREACANGKDDDCDGRTDEEEDRDRDGRASCIDCDDDDRFVFPGAPEICDSLDNDCDGACEEGLDRDGDGVSACGTRPGAGSRCESVAIPDCMDDDPLSGPGKEERCDGRDNDCDGVCDEDQDADGDGWTGCGTFAGDAAPGGFDGVCGLPQAALEDCRADEPAVHPFAHELCNGVDDDCDEAPLAATPCFAQGAGCVLGRASCDDTRPGGLGACQAAGGVAVAAAACAADCASSPDPYRCAVEAAARWRLDCEIAYRRVTGDPARPPFVEMCPDREAALPAVAEASGCSWEVALGMDQERVRLGLVRTAGLAPAASIPSCTGRLVVVGPRDARALPPDEAVLLFRVLGGPAELARLRLTPREVDACPASPLGCTLSSP
jgi:hypothetical protein